ncbi:stage III sporulation protein AG [Virgibacillus siamensis]|uniref:stage III sporulation protein AG n=1 Tax=Virgibacillus siamensis TaxID=480071 RepID=UPI001FE9AFC6|nr:stage III sporulation protein AG [Virgibacillus siamensis]
MKEKLINFFKSRKTGQSDKLPGRSGYIIIIGLIGLLLILIGNAFSSEPEGEQTIGNSPQPMEKPAKEAFSDKSDKSTNVDEIETNYEKELTEMLNKINGVSNAEVMVNLNSTKVKVYEKNLISGQQTTEETDKKGGTREIEDSSKETQVVLVRQGDKEVPLLVQTKKPEVRGVFIVAEGVDHATVKKWVIDAVSRVLDVPTHRVSVMPKN